MTGKSPTTLLRAGDPSPVRIDNPAGQSLFLLLGDHAGSGIPGRLGNLGLPEADLQRHIALDIGVARLGRTLAAALDAVFVEQSYSRLVVDCNRAEGSPESIVATSDGTIIAGNAKLDEDDRERRYREIFDPYHAAIAAALDQRKAEGRGVILVSLHSFTPVLGPERRPWDVGILHDGGDTAFALALARQLRSASRWCIGDNEPYRMDDTDYTVPFHAYSRGLPYAEIEIRQDHLASEAGVASVARELGRAMTSLESRTKTPT
jgi:predicted N-formylglutamate amidohydrolase